MTTYKGWQIYGSGNEWEAWRHGVRMRANSKALLVEMIDLRQPFSSWWKEQFGGK